MDYRVVIIESDTAQAEKVAKALKEVVDFEVVEIFDNVAEAMDQSSKLQVNMFLLDIDDHRNITSVPKFLKKYPKAILLCMMEYWNADFADQCITFGASGCIMNPSDGEEILESIELFNKRGSTKPAKIIAFFSPKGRSAKTTLVTNLALSLAQLSGEAVGIIDADLQFGDVPIFFDVEPENTIVEAIRDVGVLSPLKLSPYFMQVIDGLYILSSPRNPQQANLVERENLIKIVRMAGNLYRYVLIDLPSGVDPFVMGVCEFADTIILSGMIGSGFEVNHMKRSLEMFQGWSDYGKNVHVIFSRVDPCNEESQKQLAEELNNPVYAILPNEYLLMSAANSGRLLERNEVSTSITQQFDRIAKGLLNDPQR